MAYTLIAHQKAGAPSNVTAAVTSAIDTTGATFLTAAVSDANTASTTLTDFYNNTWVLLTPRNSGGGSRIRIYYVVTPTVGAGHTLTGTPVGTAVCSVAFQAWSGSLASPFDVENGAASSGTPGSVTPSVDGCLVLQALTHQSASATLTGSYTIVDEVAIVGGAHFSISVAYQIQTTATATNTTWTATAPGSAVAVFKPSAVGVVDSNQTVRRRSHRPRPYLPMGEGLTNPKQTYH